MRFIPGALNRKFCYHSTTHRNKRNKEQVNLCLPLENHNCKFRCKVHWPPLVIYQRIEPIPPERDGSSAATLARSVRNKHLKNPAKRCIFFVETNRREPYAHKSSEMGK